MKLSPVAQRRLHNFRANRRGWWSLWIFSALFTVSLCADFIANDKPLMVVFESKLHFPIFKEYPETVFGGDFPTEADYRDPHVAALIEAKGRMVWPLIRYNHRTINFNTPTPAPSPPTAENLLGTDDQGRDVLARVLYGFRVSVLFGGLLAILGSIIGVAVGAVEGWFGGLIDILSQRFMEIWAGMPVLFLLIILSSVVEPTFSRLLLVMLLFGWMSLVDVVRAEFLRGRNLEYVRAAQALGASNLRIMFKHLLPNAMTGTLTYLPFVLNGAIITLTSLDFLGFGLPPGSASLGELLQQGKTNIQAPWLGLTAFLTPAILLSLLVFIGEAVRDAFDPRRG